MHAPELTGICTLQPPGVQLCTPKIIRLLGVWTCTLRCYRKEKILRVFIVYIQEIYNNQKHHEQRTVFES